MKKIETLKIILGVMMLLLVLVGCGDEVKTIKIAEQYGIAYAPLQVMKDYGLLEEALGDGYEVEWVKLANTAAIREAMLGDGLDVGFVGIPPLLIGIDTGMDWKIISGLSESPVGLVVNDSSITDLSQLLGIGKIVVPQPGSIQHILLAMSAKKLLGDAKIFDVQLISMKHPDGAMALNAGQEVVAHYTSPPYLFQELENKDNKLLLTGTDAVGGPYTFIVGMCREGLYEDQEVYESIKKAIDQSIQLLNDQSPEVVERLAEDYELDEASLLAYLNADGMAYGMDVKGLEAFIDFMVAEGYLEKDLEMKDVMWDAK